MGGRGGSASSNNGKEVASAPATAGAEGILVPAGAQLPPGTIVLPAELGRALAISEIARRLENTIQDRVAAHRLLDGLDAKSLKEVGKALNLPKLDGTKSELVNRIIEFTVGNRLNSAAIRSRANQITRTRLESR